LKENLQEGTKEWEKYSDKIKDSFKKTLDFSLWGLPKKNFIYFPKEEKKFLFLKKELRS